MEHIQSFLAPIGGGLFTWLCLVVYSTIVLIVSIRSRLFWLIPSPWRRFLRRLHAFIFAITLVLLGVSLVLAASLLLGFFGGFFIVFGAQLFIELLKPREVEDYDESKSPNT